jgi:hypothetical protein
LCTPQHVHQHATSGHAASSDADVRVDHHVQLNHASVPPLQSHAAATSYS